MMQNMTNYNYGDVVLVPFPFTDQTITKNGFTTDNQLTESAIAQRKIISSRSPTSLRSRGSKVRKREY